MVAKVVFVLCLQMVLMKYTLAQCIPMAAIQEPCGPIFGVPSAYTSGLAMQMPWIPSPYFSVSSDDLSVAGVVTVCGTMPFLGTVSMAGELPAVGEGTVMYNCGNGDIGIVHEVPFAGMLAPMGSSGLAMQMQSWIPAPYFSVSSDDLSVAGMVTVCGTMPFLGTVSMTGELPAVEEGTVMYNCGNGDIGIVHEVPFAGMLAPMGSRYY